jgi:cytoskeletal protein CcmA (bactofilin family)
MFPFFPFGQRTNKRINLAGVKFDTLIGNLTTIFGNVVYGKAIRIDGTVHGNVYDEHKVPGSPPGVYTTNITVGPTGHVEGHMSAYTIIVEGITIGDLVATNVHIAAGAIVRGTIHYTSIIIEPGAVVEGELKLINPIKDDQQVDENGPYSFDKEAGEWVHNSENSPPSDVLNKSYPGDKC